MDIHIDVERLAKSLNYWNNTAPEGATHYLPECDDWYKEVVGSVPLAYVNYRWEEAKFPERVYNPAIISRPAAPAVPPAAPPVDEFPLSLVRFIKFAIKCNMPDRDIAETIRHFPRIQSKA